MQEMGYGEATTSIQGGTDEAHRRLDEFLGKPDDVATFSKPRTGECSLFAVPSCSSKTCPVLNEALMTSPDQP